MPARPRGGRAAGPGGPHLPRGLLNDRSPPKSPQAPRPARRLRLTLAVVLSLGGGRDFELPAGGDATGVEIPPAASAAERVELLQRAARDGDADADVFTALGQAYLQRARDRRPRLLLARGAQLRRRAPARRAQRRRGARRRHARRPAATTSASSCAAGARRNGLPGLVAPLPEIADAQIELGRYGAAEQTLQRLIDFKPSVDLILARVLPARAHRRPRRRRRGDAARGVGRSSGDPRTSPTCRCCSATSSFSEGGSAAARLASRWRSDHCPATPPAWSDSRAPTRRRRSGESHRPPASAAAQLPLTATLVALAEIEQAPGGHRADAALDAARAAALYAAATRCRTPRRSCSRPTTATRSGPSPRSPGSGEARRASARRTPSAGPSCARVSPARRVGYAARSAPARATALQPPRRRRPRAGRRSRAAERYFDLARRGQAALSPASAALLEEGLR